MVDVAALTKANLARWEKAKLLPSWRRLLTSVAKALVAAKPRYLAVQKATGVPWYVIAVIHERESSQNWGRSLAQGDPFNKVSVNVPRGRGPFASWEEAAIDALVSCPPYLSRRKSWSVGDTLTNLELYNGVGYANRGKPSPYLWSGTDQYWAGKYVKDGVYDPTAIDKQSGTAALLIAMAEIDEDVRKLVKPPVDLPASIPSDPKPAPVKKDGWLVTLIKAALSWKR